MPPSPDTVGWRAPASRNRCTTGSEGVRCPVLLLVGEAPHASGIRPDEIGLLAVRLPRFERWDVQDAAHFIAEEAPGAVVSAVAHVLVVAQAGQDAAAGGRQAAPR